MRSGIYAIINNANQKIYVGSSSDIERRIGTHKAELARSMHNIKNLQKDYDKYGPAEFDFRILEECETESLLEREWYWAHLLNVFDKSSGYNTGVISLKHAQNANLEPMKYRYIDGYSLVDREIKKEDS